MEVLEKIIKFLRFFVSTPRKIIFLLIGIIVAQFSINLLYTRTLKNNLKLARQNSQNQQDSQSFSTTKLTFTPSQIAFLLKGLNISTNELYQYYKPKIDSINNLIINQQQELERLKNQLVTNPGTANINLLNRQMSFTEQQINFYKAVASFWEKRSRGLRNLVKTLGLDSIMVYLSHQDSINQIITNPSVVEKLILRKNNQQTGLVEVTPALQNVADNNKSSLPSSTISSKKPVKSMKTIEPESPKRHRSKPGPILSSTISESEMKAMLKKYYFFDYFWNQDARGFDNEFEIQTIKGQTVIVDRATRLMWQQGGSSKSMDYQSAKKWIDELNQRRFAGFNDWRLPTLKEAMTLVEPHEIDLLYIDRLFRREQNWIWTSDYVDGKDCAWVVSFSLGGCRSSYDLSTNSYYVRAVRSLGPKNQ